MRMLSVLIFYELFSTKLFIVLPKSTYKYILNLI